jgi:hypothetical protein
MAAVPEIHGRHAAALRGLTASPLDLGDAASSDVELRARLDDERTPIAIYYYYFCNADLAYHAGDLSRAATLLREAGRHLCGIFGEPAVVELCFLRALVAARQLDGAPPWQRLPLMAALIRCDRALAAWARDAPDNYQAHASIVRAELWRALGRRREAERSYGEAIAVARRQGANKREALALELASSHAAAVGDDPRAEQLRREAIAAYRRWGSPVKADALARAIRS